jgi:hypothetical protein
MIWDLTWLGLAFPYMVCVLLGCVKRAGCVGLWLVAFGWLVEKKRIE